MVTTMMGRNKFELVSNFAGALLTKEYKARYNVALLLKHRVTIRYSQTIAF